MPVKLHDKMLSKYSITGAPYTSEVNPELKILWIKCAYLTLLFCRGLLTGATRLSFHNQPVKYLISPVVVTIIAAIDIKSPYVIRKI